MTNWLILLIKQFIDIIKYLLVADALFDLEYDKNKKLKEILALSIIIILVYLVLFEHIVDIWVDLNAFICLIVQLILFRNKRIKTIKVTIVSTVVTTILEQFTDLFIRRDIYDVSNYDFIISNFFRFVIVIIFSFLFKYKRKMNMSDSLNYIYLNIFFGFSSTLFPLVIVQTNLFKIKTRLALITTVFAYINIIISIISIILFIKNKNEKDKYYLENIVKDETLKLQEDYYQKLIDNYASLRNFKHDIKAHYHVLYKLLDNNKHVDAKEYLENIFEKISSVDVYSTNNLYISSILNSFDQTFKDNQINFDFSYNVNSVINMDNMDICSLFYNLVINAIEANLKLSNDRYIILNIVNIKNNLLIKILNPINDIKEIEYIQERKSSKIDTENHGIGLQKIDEIVAKYNGKNEYKIEDNCLINQIVLLNVLEF
ncbi:GHKL domain-containing protein [uncultured Thomasclavelia sp.]|uniref:sensor histidine kinase n=1 Tax=uncultured Thomasclavelia sp. TaxID=3025759 RepID=UPI002632D6A7|nr:GHKL domain-containing protein [uncultured Thomasclavelia sp.]